MKFGLFWALARYFWMACSLGEQWFLNIQSDGNELIILRDKSLSIHKEDTVTDCILQLRERSSSAGYVLFSVKLSEWLKLAFCSSVLPTRPEIMFIYI